MHGENELEENNPMSQEKITAPTLPPDDLQEFHQGGDGDHRDGEVDRRGMEAAQERPQRGALAGRHQEVHHALCSLGFILDRASLVYPSAAVPVAYGIAGAATVE